MSGELASAARGLRRLRVDPQVARVAVPAGRWRLPLVIALAIVFVLFGAARLDVGRDEAPLGLAAGEALGPFGRVVGGWEPSLWPAQVAPSRIWAWFEAGKPTSNSVRWPAAIAWVLTALLITRRMNQALGARASILAAVCLLGSFAWIDRSSTTGIEPIAGLAIVAALDRILNQGSDRIAGVWAALAVLAGGWPPLAMIVLPIVVLGRPQAKLSKALVIPPILALVAWSIWARRSAPAQVWAAALTLPLTQKMAWRLGLEVIVLALPWSLIAGLWAFRSVRENLAKSGVALVTGWLQTAGVALLAGSLVPGLATSARLPILVALAVTSAAVLDRAWANALSTSARRTLFGMGLFSAATVAAVMAPYGIYLAAAYSYYRLIAIILTFGASATLLLAIGVANKGMVRGMIGVFLAIALLMKGAHAGVFVPEWNYRFSEGPWGRAVGQWVPPGWTLYTTLDWGPDFAFATGRTVRRLAHPKILEYRLGNHPEFVLLKAGDFEHWPESAPRLIKVREFEDQYLGINVLARTEGQFDISRMAEDHD
jgi:hypothetical protein